MADLLSRLRHVPDRLLHRARRRAALAALTTRRPPAYILVICSGNLFRSPFAAALLQRELARQGASEIRVESAGFTGPGRRSPPRAIAAAARRGIDLAGHHSLLAIPDLVRAADLIVVMEEGHRRTIRERFGRAAGDVLLLGDLDPASVASRAIEDPAQRGPEVCDRAYARIERCVTQFANAVGMARGSASPR